MFFHHVHTSKNTNCCSSVIINNIIVFIISKVILCHDCHVINLKKQHVTSITDKSRQISHKKFEVEKHLTLKNKNFIIENKHIFKATKDSIINQSNFNPQYNRFNKSF
jgi:hypothetical protein